MAILGIDLGTSSVKVMVLDVQGHALSTGRAGYDVMAPRSGWSESDPAAWWSATVSSVKMALAQVPHIEITAIGLSGQMHGVVLTDVEGQPVRPAILWADTRAQEQLECYRALPLSLQKRLANPLVPGMAGPILCWLAEHEVSAYQLSRWALQPKDWLRYRLTGEAATDPGDASATLLYDLLADTWADDVIAALNLRRNLFSPILPSASIAGHLSTEAAGELGLPAGLPVATGTSDTAAAALGTGLSVSGPVQLTLGTGAQFLQLCSKPDIDHSGRTHLYRAADACNWYTMAAIQNAGLALDWVCRVLNATWDELYASAVVPRADDLFFLPYLTPERPHHPVPGSTGAWLGMRIDHQRVHLLHAALEGVAFGIRVAFEALPSQAQHMPLRLAGGGSEHPAWRQMLADILNRELLTIDATSASARGAALLGGIATGIWTDARETATLAPSVSLVTVPDVKWVEVYEELYGRYLRCLQ